MAAPAFGAASGGQVIATGGAIVDVAGGSLGDLVLLHIMQDGTGAGPTLSAGAAGDELENLAGTDATLTVVGGGALPVGSPTVANQYIWVGRKATSSGFGNITVTTSGDDLYVNLYRFTGVNAGTTLSDVIENSTAGTAVNEVGNTAAVTDTGVTTLGVDRLALNLVGVNDDNALAAFTGMTGGTWAESADFASATGTDGAVQLQTATIASAGTINGGSQTMALADPWGVVGFALIPVGAATPKSLIYQPGLQVAIPRSLYVR